MHSNLHVGQVIFSYSSLPPVLHGALHCRSQDITKKKRLFKYIEQFTTKKWQFFR